MKSRGRARQMLQAATGEEPFAVVSVCLRGSTTGTGHALHLCLERSDTTMETILIIVVLLFLFGGGGYYWNSRRR